MCWQEGREKKCHSLSPSGVLQMLMEGGDEGVVLGALVLALLRKKEELIHPEPMLQPPKRDPTQPLGQSMGDSSLGTHPPPG